VAAGEPAFRPQGSGGLVERYEELRRRVLDGQADGLRLGLAVLQRQGMVAWVQAWDGLSASVVPPSPSPPSRPAASAVSGSVVAVLASMTLACVGVGGAI
jgi:hypothetical protein